MATASTSSVFNGSSSSKQQQRNRRKNGGVFGGSAAGLWLLKKRFLAAKSGSSKKVVPASTSEATETWDHVFHRPIFPQRQTDTASVTKKKVVSRSIVSTPATANSSCCSTESYLLLSPAASTSTFTSSADDDDETKIGSTNFPSVDTTKLTEISTPARDDRGRKLNKKWRRHSIATVQTMRSTKSTIKKRRKITKQPCRRRRRGQFGSKAAAFTTENDAEGVSDYFNDTATIFTTRIAANDSLRSASTSSQSSSSEVSAASLDENDDKSSVGKTDTSSLLTSTFASSSDAAHQYSSDGQKEEGSIITTSATSSCSNDGNSTSVNSSSSHELSFKSSNDDSTKGSKKKENDNQSIIEKWNEYFAKLDTDTLKIDNSVTTTAATVPRHQDGSTNSVVRQRVVNEYKKYITACSNTMTPINMYKFIRQRQTRGCYRPGEIYDGMFDI